MNRDSKNGASGADRFPVGAAILIGLLLGISLALGVALLINKGPSPFQEKKVPASTVPAEKSAAAASEGKTKFDFYKILPGTEEAVTEKEFQRPAAKTKDVYFLQVAAFQNPTDADNLKAQLALSGIEAQIQTAQLPDGKTWHRVRIGPFSDMKELNASRDNLKQNNLQAYLIKVRDQNP
jgi:cell division protein FtsN